MVRLDDAQRSAALEIFVPHRQAPLRGLVPTLLDLSLTPQRIVEYSTSRFRVTYARLTDRFDQRLDTGRLMQILCSVEHLLATDESAALDSPLCSVTGGTSTAVEQKPELLGVVGDPRIPGFGLRECRQQHENPEAETDQLQGAEPEFLHTDGRSPVHGSRLSGLSRFPQHAHPA